MLHLMMMRIKCGSLGTNPAQVLLLPGQQLCHFCVGLRTSSLSHDMIMQARLRPPLMAMLGDADAEIQGRVLAFWHSALPRTLSCRLAALLCDNLDMATSWVWHMLCHKCMRWRPYSRFF